MQPQDFLTTTLRTHPRGADVAAVLHAAVRAADPYLAVRHHLVLEGSRLRIGADHYDLDSFERVLLLAIGKAAVPMARAACECLGDQIRAGLAVPKAGGTSPSTSVCVPVLEGSHPVPDEHSFRAGEQAYRLLDSATERDFVLVLLSGGGSALITWPEDGLTLADMQALTDALLRSGATINEFNALRRRCDRVKAGGLLGAARPATVAVLVLSDVIGDDLAAIASGPFVLPAEAGAENEVAGIIARYRLAERLPAHLLRFLAREPRPHPSASLAPVPHTIIANVVASAEGALAEARARGLATERLSTDLQGEARTVGAEMARRLTAVPAERRPCCLVAGGETTVTLQGDGLGGRNQELALAAVEALAGHPDLLLVSLATDGGDGPTDAAGAVAGPETLSRGRALGLDPREFLRRNDAYHYFEPLGDLLKPGLTGTNVNDLVLLFAF